MPGYSVLLTLYEYSRWAPAGSVLSIIPPGPRPAPRPNLITPSRSHPAEKRTELT